MPLTICIKGTAGQGRGYENAAIEISGCGTLRRIVGAKEYTYVDFSSFSMERCWDKVDCIRDNIHFPPVLDNIGVL